MSTSLQVLEHAARNWPDKPAVVDAADSLTFAQLYSRVLACARAFVAHGWQAGDRFAIWAPNSINWQVAALGGQAVGCVLVPLNTRYKGAEVQDILLRSGARGIFYCRAFLDTDYHALLAGLELPGLAQRLDIDSLHSWNAPADLDITGRLAAVDEDTLADVLYTSGTTGAPKGVMCTHGQNIRVFEAWSAGVTLNADDNYLIINPYFHSFGYKAGWLAALIRGATAITMPTFDADAVLHLIEDAKITFLPGAPTIFQTLLHHPQRAASDTSSLRCAVTGAASVPVQLVKDMKHELGFREVYTAYGLTEATGVVSLCKPGDSFETIATTSGRPMEGVEVQITGSDGQALSAGEPGEIRVRGFNVMQGYLDDPTATAAAITADGWLKTGDIGVMDERGYLQITDRLKDMYICGGFNCYPAEIENILLTHPHIRDVAVTGASDPRLGEVGHAFVVVDNTGRGSVKVESAEVESAKVESAKVESVTADGIIRWARDHMANFKVPRQVTFVDELPRNASGKVQKFLLPG